MFHQKCPVPDHQSSSHHRPSMRNCGGSHWLGCGQTQNSSDQSGASGHSEQSGYNSDTGTDNNSIVYDCIKSDLQTQQLQEHHHQPHHRSNHPSVRSVHSLSNKYSENKKYNIRKNASLCVRSEKTQHLSEGQQQPPPQTRQKTPTPNQ